MINKSASLLELVVSYNDMRKGWSWNDALCVLRRQLLRWPSLNKRASCLKGVWLDDDGLAGGREKESVRNVPVVAAVAPKIMEFFLLLPEPLPNRAVMDQHVLKIEFYGQEPKVESYLLLRLPHKGQMQLEKLTDPPFTPAPRETCLMICEGSLCC
ncbi:uncharacterized [Tachysurus ichikawai]